MPIFGAKKRQFSQHNTILWAKKVNRMPLFVRFFTQKSILSCRYFVKKPSILQKTHYSHAIYCQQNVKSLKNTMLSRHFVVLIFPKIMKNNHHTNGIELVFSFDYLLNRKKMITVSFKSPYPHPLRLSSAYAFHCGWQRRLKPLRGGVNV